MNKPRLLPPSQISDTFNNQFFAQFSSNTHADNKFEQTQGRVSSKKMVSATKRPKSSGANKIQPMSALKEVFNATAPLKFLQANLDDSVTQGATRPHGSIRAKHSMMATSMRLNSLQLPKERRKPAKIQTAIKNYTDVKKLQSKRYNQTHNLNRPSTSQPVANISLRTSTQTLNKQKTVAAVQKSQHRSSSSLSHERPISRANEVRVSLEVPDSIQSSQQKQKSGPNKDKLAAKLVDSFNTTKASLQNAKYKSNPQPQKQNKNSKSQKSFKLTQNISSKKTLDLVQLNTTNQVQKFTVPTFARVNIEKINLKQKKTVKKRSTSKGSAQIINSDSGLLNTNIERLLKDLPSVNPSELGTCKLFEKNKPDALNMTMTAALLAESNRIAAKSQLAIKHIPGANMVRLQCKRLNSQEKVNLKRFKVNIVKKQLNSKERAEPSPQPQLQIAHRVRKPSLDKVIKIASLQKQLIEKTLNNTQKLKTGENLATLNANPTRLSSNSSAFQIPLAGVKLQGVKEKSQFDWTGLLANFHKECMMPKKSTSIRQTSCHQIKQIKNKTQPLPKNLIQTKPADYGFAVQKVENKLKVKLPLQTVKTSIDEAPTSRAVLTEITSDLDENASPPSTHRSPEKVNEDFTFGRKLGEGAYAVVRLATKKATGKTYAAKIYDKSKLVDEHRRQSVCREVMLMQKLHHRYIVEFFEAFETDHFVYVIMEHVQGESLHEYLKKQRASSLVQYDQTLPEEDAKRLVRQLVEVLAYLHSQGITHRDVKLENVLLDDELNIKLIDFGFSTQFQPQKKMKLFCGTPSYMAPEIVSRVEYLGPPADIWAAGVLMFCLLNGYFPFKGQTDAELYRRIQRGHYKMIRDDLTDDCLNLLKTILNINTNTRICATEVLQDNWFATDSRKKRSHDEILQQFKQRMLKQPAKRKPTTTIFIPGTTSSSGQTNQICNESDQNQTSARFKIQLQQTASPPSHQPDLTEMQMLNNEAMLAYYNTATVDRNNPAPQNQTVRFNPGLQLPQHQQWFSQLNAQQASVAPPSGNTQPQNFTPYNAYSTE